MIKIEKKNRLAKLFLFLFEFKAKVLSELDFLCIVRVGNLLLLRKIFITQTKI